MPEHKQPVTQNNEISDVALFAALSYIPFFPLFLIMYKRENTFMHFHARQGLVVFIIEALSHVLMKMLPGLSLLFSIFNIFLLVVAVIGLFAALMGKDTRFPLIGDLAEKLIV